MAQQQAARLTLNHRLCRFALHALLILTIGLFAPALLGGCAMLAGVVAAAAWAAPDRSGLRFEDAGYEAESAWGYRPYGRLTYE